jgi:hypothetical protein
MEMAQQRTEPGGNLRERYSAQSTGAHVHVEIDVPDAQCPETVGPAATGLRFQKAPRLPQKRIDGCIRQTAFVAQPSLVFVVDRMPECRIRIDFGGGRPCTLGQPK